MWFRFLDMHSGGSRKLSWSVIYVEATDRADAVGIFEKTFGRDPENVTCRCCGEDYSVDEEDTLEAASAYDRGIGGFFEREIIPYDHFERTGEVWDMGNRVPAKIVRRSAVA